MTDPDEQAFTVPAWIPGSGVPEPPVFGLTKREWFAGLAMQGLLSMEADEIDKGNEPPELAPEYATAAVTYADALIAALNAKKE